MYVQYMVEGCGTCETCTYSTWWEVVGPVRHVYQPSEGFSLHQLLNCSNIYAHQQHWLSTNCMVPPFTMFILFPVIQLMMTPADVFVIV